MLVVILYLTLVVEIISGLSTFPNFHLRNGKLQSSIRDIKLCLDECVKQNCAGFDFNFNARSCYLHSSASECGSLIRKNSCVHYRFIDCTATTVVAPTGPPTGKPTTGKPITIPPVSALVPFPDVHIPKGTYIQFARTLFDCYNLCYQSPSCQSFDWDNGRCFVHKERTACDNLMFKLGSDHYRITANCNPVPFNCFTVTFQVFPESSRSGGRRIAINVNFDQCKQLCKARTGCQAVDWDVLDQSCWEHSTTGRPLANNCCKHARKLCNDGTTQAPLLTTTRIIANTTLGPTTPKIAVTTPGVKIQDDGKCPSELLAVPGMKSGPGTGIPGITDADACKAWCLTNANCAAVDFDNVATSGNRCSWHDIATYDVTTAVGDTCCTQYRKLAPCEIKRCWNMPRQAVTTNMTAGSLTFYVPVDELFNLEPNMTDPTISLDPCTGLCKLETHFTRNTNTGDINPFNPVEAERTCDSNRNPVINSHKNCETKITGSDPINNSENVTFVCYCSADQCNAFWSQVIEACIAHYPLDCHTLDLTFGQRHGKGFNLEYSGTDQAKNWSGIFDGTSFIQIDTFMNNVLGMVGPANNLRPEFTMLFWFKFTSKEATNMTIISNGPHGQASLDIMTSHANDTHRNIHAIVRINGKVFTGSVGALYDQWQYFSLRILPVANYEIYLDVGDTSQVVDSMMVQTDIPTTGTGSRIDPTGNPLCIGKQYIPTNVPSFNIPGEFYKGSLDEIWMFRKGLAENELNSLVQSSFYPVRLNP